MIKTYEHHIKYKEIDGVDETVWLPWSEHQKLHVRLRREGTLKVSPEELHKISNRAWHRTTKGRAYYKTNKQKEYSKNHSKNYLRNKRIQFRETIGLRVGLNTDIIYYPTGNVCVTSYFQGHNGTHLFYIDIDKNPAPVVADKEYEVM